MGSFRRFISTAIFVSLISDLGFGFGEKCNIIHVAENSSSRIDNGDLMLGTIWIWPGKTFKNISFQPVIGTKDDDEHLTLSRETFLNPSNTDDNWRKIDFNIVKESHMIRRNRYYINILYGGIEITKTIKLWWHSVKGLKVYINGGAQVSMNCKPQVDIKDLQKEKTDEKSLIDTVRANDLTTTNKPEKYTFETSSNLPYQQIEYTSSMISTSSNLHLDQRSMQNTQNSTNAKKDEMVESDENKLKEFGLEYLQFQYVLLIIIVVLFFIIFLIIVIVIAKTNKRNSVSKNEQSKFDATKTCDSVGKCTNSYEKPSIRNYPSFLNDSQSRYQNDFSTSTCSQQHNSSAEKENEYEYPANYQKSDSLDRNFDNKYDSYQESTYVNMNNFNQ